MIIDHDTAISNSYSLIDSAPYNNQPIFSNKGYISRHLRVFPIAVCLARGTRFALAPAVLAAIYMDLGFLKAKIVEFVNSGIEGCSVLKLKAPFQLVQLWVWERFPMLGPEPIVIPHGAPRLARWRNLNRVNVGCLRFNFEPIDDVFVWRPYAVCVENWHFPEFYSNEEKIVLLNPEDGLELLSFAKCLRNCGLVGLDCIEQYLPHRVGMQFGMDQDVPGPVSRLDQSLKLAWRSYDEPIVGVRLYLPPKLLKGGVTVPYLDWWRTASRNCGYDGLPSLKCGHMQENLSLHLAGRAEDNGSKGACLSSRSNVFAASDYQSEVFTRTYGENQPQLNLCLNMDDSLEDCCENIADELFQNPDNSDWQAYMSLISGFGDSDWQGCIETISPSDKSTNLTKSHDGISKSTPLQNLECTSVEVLNCEESTMPMAEWKSSETAMVEEREELMIDPTSSLPNETPTLRIARFLKPSLNTSSSLPPFPEISSCSLSSKPINAVFIDNSSPIKNWQPWVQKLQQTHEAVWRNAGIFDAIKGSTYHINKNNDLIFKLAEKWCPETNTFIFPWGEVTVTLEDVMILGGFSTLGESVLCSSSAGLNVEHLENILIEYFRTSLRTDHNVTHYKWMEYFIGLGGDIENAGCLSLWLSRHVFQLKTRGIVSRKVLPIAARLSCGIKIALAPAVLASIYRDLTLLKRKILSSSSGQCDDDSCLTLLAPLQLVQVWAWERFPSLGAVPRMIGLGETRLARWSDLCCKGGNFDMEMCLDSARDTFCWRPYAVSLENWLLPRFYADSGTWVDVDSDEAWKSFARCLMVCKLVGLNSCIEGYNPHRVALQFGFDQDIPDPIPNDNSSLQDLRSLYLPPRLYVGDVTHRYSDWWKTGFQSVLGEACMGCKKRKRSLRNTKKLCKMRQSNPGIIKGSSYSECTESHNEAKLVTAAERTCY